MITDYLNLAIHYTKENISRAVFLASTTAILSCGIYKLAENIDDAALARSGLETITQVNNLGDKK